MKKLWLPFFVILLILSSCVRNNIPKYQLSAKSGEKGFDAVVIDNETGKIYFIDPYTTVLEVDLKTKSINTVKLFWPSEKREK